MGGTRAHIYTTGFLSLGWNLGEIGLGLGYPHAKELGRGVKGRKEGKAPVGGLFMSGCGFNALIAHLRAMKYGSGRRGIVSGSFWQNPLGAFRFSSSIISSVPPFVTGHGGRVSRGGQWMMKDTLSMKETKSYLTMDTPV